MNDIPTSDPLLWEALPDLTLNIAQTAALCGISVRQLGYWTRQGYVAAQGHGSRRTYGLEAVRRVLAIRKAMDAGASLRQSLRQVTLQQPTPQELPFSLPPSSSPSASSSPSFPPTGTLQNGDLQNTVPASVLSSREAEALTQNLKALFERNQHTRDHASGLAVKLGRHEDDVRVVAERLCAAGVLSQSVCQGMAIFRRARREGAYV